MEANFGGCYTMLALENLAKNNPINNFSIGCKLRLNGKEKIIGGIKYGSCMMTV